MNGLEFDRFLTACNCQAILSVCFYTSFLGRNSETSVWWKPEERKVYDGLNGGNKANYLTFYL